MDKFQKELEALINRYSMENASNTPDFLLAEFLVNCLRAFNLANKQKEKWNTYGPTQTLDYVIKKS